MKGEAVYFYAFDVANEIQTAKVGEILASKPSPIEIHTDRTFPKDVPLYRPFGDYNRFEGILVAHLPYDDQSSYVIVRTRGHRTTERTLQRESRTNHSSKRRRDDPPRGAR